MNVEGRNPQQKIIHFIWEWTNNHHPGFRFSHSLEG